MRVNRGVGLFICLLLAVRLSVAQSPNGTISGIVLDTSGGVIVGADVLIINNATGVEYPGKANGEGYYVVPNIPPGTYRIQVSNSGFKTIIKPDIVVHVQDALAINFTLPIGAASEIVTVQGGAPLIDTENAAVSTVVDRQFAENLPMNGRSFQTLIQLTPGVVLTTSNSADSGQFSVNGQRAASNYWMVDGVSANIGAGSGTNPGNGLGGTLGSFSALGGTNSLVSVDAMQEFRIQTSTYAPEFGRTPGGQISIVTRSGTNQFHGAVFEYLRNDVFDANNWFNTSVAPALPKAKERQNDFGGTVSGPILKDRTFFFFSYEGLRLRLPQTVLSTVPDASFTPGTTNSRQNAILAMQPYLNAFPLPNPTSPEILCNPNANPNCPPSGKTGSAAFNASYSNPASLDAYSLRIDHHLNDKLAFFGRYNYSPSVIVARGGSTGLSALSEVDPSRITIQTATLGATSSISPAVTNDLRFNYSRTNAETTMRLDDFGGAVPLSSSPFPNGFTSQNAAFSFNIDSLGTGRALVAGLGGELLQRQINFIESLSAQKGSHSLKVGVDFRRLSPLRAPPVYVQFVPFSDVPSAETGNPLGGQIASHAELTLLFRNLGVFAQDTWRIAPRLTLTYGIRWDVDFAPSSLNGPSTPAVTGYNLNDFSALAIAPPGTPPFKTTYGNIAPRVGLAYQLTQNQDWQAVLRGGFGVFYDLVSSEVGSAISGSEPPFAAFNIIGGAFPFDPAKVAPPIIPSVASISALATFNPNLKLPYVLEWNVAFEQSLGGQQSVSASYIGAAGRRLLQTTAFSAPPTNPNVSADFVDNVAISDYDALQVEFQRRLSRGLQALASYTWGHSIDTGSAGSLFGNPANAGLGSNVSANRGPSDFDIRNAFSAGVTYDVPTPKINALADSILRGWSLQNIIQVRSAPPVDVSDSNFYIFNNGLQPDIRPDLVPGHPLYLHGPQYTGGKAFNPLAFQDPPVDPNTLNPFRQGNVPRNFLRGFGATQWDFAVHREFPIRELLKVQFRVEIFNVLNHPNFGQPSGCFGSFCSTPFGVSTQMLGQSLAGNNLGGGGFSPLYQIGGPRSMQFALKLMF